MHTITYAIHEPDGLVYSRVGSDIAFPVLQYDDMTPENGFRATYKLDKGTVFEFCSDWGCLKWTKKIPRALKNRHRRFWGMKPLPR